MVVLLVLQVSITTLTTVGTLNSSSGNGNSGVINLNAPDGNIFAGDIDSSGESMGGDISLTSPSGTVSLSGNVNSFSTSVNAGNGGDVEITARKFVIEGGATVSANTEGSGTGQAGLFTINALESFEMSGASKLSFNSFATDGTGNFSLTAPTVTLQDGSRISVSTSGTEQAGSFIVNASEFVEVSGISAIDGSPGGLFFDTTSAKDAGVFSINTERLTIRDGAQVSNVTAGVSEGGTLAVNANSLEVSGSSSRLSFNMEGSGDAKGLRIEIEAGQLAL